MPRACGTPPAHPLPACPPPACPASPWWVLLTLGADGPRAEQAVPTGDRGGEEHLPAGGEESACLG